MLKPIPKGHNHTKKGFFGWFNRVFNAGTRTYSGWIGKTLRKAGVMFVIYLALGAGAFVLISRLPSSFIPSEDQGFIMTTVQLPSGATAERTEKTLSTLNQVAHSMPEVQDVITVSGFSFTGSGQNMGMGFIMLKDWKERAGAGSTANAVAGKITGAMMSGAIQDRLCTSIEPAADYGIGATIRVSASICKRAAHTTTKNWWHAAMSSSKKCAKTRLCLTQPTFAPTAWTMRRN